MENKSLETIPKERLLFVYNANSGRKNTVMDVAHKILSPKTYDCNLCDITYGALTERKVWRKYRERSAMEMEFLHKDEFAKTYASKFGYKFTFPIILADTGQNFDVYIGTDELNALENAEDLIQILESR